MKRANYFQLAFPAKDIRLYASYNAEKEACAAGNGIARGDYSKENVSAIFEWKTKGRGRSRLKGNTPGQIRNALKRTVKAISKRDDRAAMESLLTLKGVGVPVASAILTCVSRKYTIIDFRALHALGCQHRGQPSLNFYLQYLQYCREIARENRVSLRVLDRALWHWPKRSTHRK